MHFIFPDIYARVKQLTEASSIVDLQQEVFRLLGNTGEQMFTDRVINMMPCPVYRPLAPYFLFKAVESKNISCCLTKETSVFQMNT